MNENAIIQNLIDCGCCQEQISLIMENLTTGEKDECLRLLHKQRKELLNSLHREQKHIDCLDYLVFMLNKN